MDRETLGYTISLISIIGLFSIICYYAYLAGGILTVLLVVFIGMLGIGRVLIND